MQPSHCGALGLLNPPLANCGIHPQTVLLSFFFPAPLARSALRLPGEAEPTGPEPFVMCISIFVLLYEAWRSVSKQLSDRPQASRKKW